MKEILLIDDNLIDQTIFSKLFSYFGIEIKVASDGEEGIHLAELIKPALILLDIKMPVMNGFETLAHIRQIEIIKDIPVVMLSAGIITLEEEASILLDTAGMLRKPVLPKDIDALLKKYKIIKD